MEQGTKQRCASLGLETMRPTAMLLMLAILTAAPLAAAEEQPPIDAIVASRLQPDEPADQVWEQTLADLERDHPAVARAVRQPDFIQEVSDDEEASTQAFFAQMASRNATALKVGDHLYSVGITLASGLPPADDAAVDEDGKDAPGLGLALLAVALVGLAAASRKT